MSKWDEMSASDRDAVVAELVMGWKLLDRRACGWGDGPPVFETGESLDDPNSSPTYQDPRFTTDARADYLVLCKVRETWNEKQREEFGAQLWSILADRGYDDVQYYLGYRPGDYSHAAYLALEGHNDA